MSLFGLSWLEALAGSFGIFVYTLLCCAIADLIRSPTRQEYADHESASQPEPAQPASSTEAREPVSPQHPLAEGV